MNQAIKPPRKTIGQHIFDWVNNCDLTQLDAIMLALFVFVLGCGTIGSLYLMGHLQNLLDAHHKPVPYMVVQTDHQIWRLPCYGERRLNGVAPYATAVRYAPTPLAAPAAVVSERTAPTRFGTPRTDWQRYSNQQAAQAFGSPY